jgi:hypothetical protein
LPVLVKKKTIIPNVLATALAVQTAMHNIVIVGRQCSLYAFQK